MHGIVFRISVHTSRRFEEFNVLIYVIKCNDASYHGNPNTTLLFNIIQTTLLVLRCDIDENFGTDLNYATTLVSESVKQLRTKWPRF